MSRLVSAALVAGLAATYAAPGALFEVPRALHEKASTSIPFVNCSLATKQMIFTGVKEALVLTKAA
jgi:hypothetical protein